MQPLSVLKLFPLYFSLGHCFAKSTETPTTKKMHNANRQCYMEIGQKFEKLVLQIELTLFCRLI